ncbi:TPA: hypothetical protein HA363_01605 [Candidatus Woesearchaeota archaeon]|nr:hypothetical protein [Candidatus Woesearchaeota archaeon]
MGKQILYLENDFTWVELVKPQLERHGQVTAVDNEHDFRGAIDDMASRGEWPSAVVLEQRVRWTHPAPEIPEPPAEVRAEGFANAGIRCYDYLRQMQNGSGKTPVIFYSTVEPEKISEVLLRRGIGADPMDYQCVEKIDTFTGLHNALRKVI